MADALRRGAGVAALVAAVVGVLAAVQWRTQFPLVFAAVSPTAYQLYSAPAAESSRVRKALFAHAVAIGGGVAALFVFGLLGTPALEATQVLTGPRVVAIASSLLVTLFVLESLGVHHAPAAATVLLVASGTARPGLSLAGLAIALAVIIAVGPLAGRLMRTAPASNPDAAPAGTERGR